MNSDIIAIYHYYFKSIEEYCLKKDKSDAYSGTNGRVFLEDNGLLGANHYDDYMLKYVGKIKDMINSAKKSFRE